MENLRNQSQATCDKKLFENDSVAMSRSKVTLKLNKPAYFGMCILGLSKVLMYEFQYEYVKDKYVNNSRLFLTDNDSLMHRFKMEDVCEDFIKNKEMFDFGNYSGKSKHFHDLINLVAGKRKDETGGIAIEELVGLKPKMYSFLVNDSSEHKKVKDVKKNIVATITEYKYVSLNNKCLRNSVNRI